MQKIDLPNWTDIHINSCTDFIIAQLKIGKQWSFIGATSFKTHGMGGFADGIKY